MKLGLQQNIRLGMELRINPRLYQAMDLLYMPLLDLQQHLKQELVQNPFLDLIEATEEQLDEEKEKDEDEIDWEEILLNGFETGGRREEYEEREYYEPTAVATRDLYDHLRDQLTLQRLDMRQLVIGEEIIGNIDDDGFLVCPLEQIVESLNAYLRGESVEDQNPAEGGDGAAGEILIGHAELAEATDDIGASYATELIEGAESADRGAEPVEHVGSAEHSALVEPAVAAEPAEPARYPMSTEHGESVAVEEWPLVTYEEVSEMLDVIQALDPAGIGARDLRECLLLQLQDKEMQGTLVHKVIADHFDQVVNHRWADISKALGVSPQEVQAAADEIAKLDPKPGLQYSGSQYNYVTPDLIVEKVDAEYIVFHNDTAVPRLRLSAAYRQIAQDKSKFKGENKEFISNKLNNANWMIQAIEQRRQTMLKVMNFIVDRQRDFFEEGIEHLKPLTLREVAEVIDMHESTVSRVSNQKYVQTPRGVFPLKFFFSSGLSTDSGEDVSARGIKARIQKLVGDEDSKKPLTDRAIVDILKREGVKIARRTVAKYRDQLGILSARMRKRV